jgi:hypothetical protein
LGNDVGWNLRWGRKSDQDQQGEDRSKPMVTSICIHFMSCCRCESVCCREAVASCIVLSS